MKIKAPVIILTFLALFLLVSGLKTYYKVDASEEAVVFRFGKHVRTEPAGPHFKFPFVETVSVVNVEKQHKLVFGFESAGASNPYENPPSAEEAKAESTVMTGDEKLAVILWSVVYQVEDPLAYLTKTANPELILRDLTESGVRRIIGNKTVDNILTVGRQDIETQSRDLIDTMSGELDLGFKIVRVEISSTGPIREVQASFDLINTNNQERDRMINVANREYNAVVPEARGKAARDISVAEGKAQEMLDEAKGDLARFTALFAEYEQNPEATMTQIYYESLGRILGGANVKIVDEDLGDVRAILDLSPASQLPIGNAAVITE